MHLSIVGIIFLQFLQSTTPLSIVVCQPTIVQKQKIVSLYADVLCNNGASPETRDQRSIRWDTLPLPNYVILIHRGNLGSDLLRATRILSSHQISYVLVDLKALDDLSGVRHSNVICPKELLTSTTPGVVLNFAGVSLQDLCVFSEDCRLLPNSVLNSSLATFISQCRNVLWVEPILCKNDTATDQCSVIHLYGAVKDGSSVNSESRRDTIYKDTSRLALSMKNKTLIIGTLPAETGPFVETFNTTINGTTKVSYSGIIFEILNEIAKHLQFNYEVITPLDLAIGIINANGSSSGVVGLVQHRDVDVAAYDISITEGRKNIVDFAPPFYFHSTSILILAPERQQSMKLWNWASPFSLTVWACLVATMLLVSFILYFGHVYCMPEMWADTRFQHISDCVSYVGSGSVNQGIDLSPKSWWGQTLLTLWWILCVLEIASYSSFLVATLTAPPPQSLPFYTLHGLAELTAKNEYKVCLPGGTAFYDELTKSPFADYRTINSWLKRNPAYVASTSGECIDKMIKEKNVAFMDRTSTLEQYQKRACKRRDFILLAERLWSRPVSFAFPKNSPYTAAFSEKLSEIIEEGLMELWYRNYSRPSDVCTVLELDDLNVIRAATKRLGLDDLGGVFVLLCIGVMISCAGLLLEYFIRKKSRSKALFLLKGVSSMQRGSPIELIHCEDLDVRVSNF